MAGKALVIAYYFPPIACSGTIRTLKFVKYLERHGWSSVVVSVDPHYEHVESRDAALLAELPDSAAVLRSYAWHPANLIRRGKAAPSAAGAQNGAASGRASASPSFLNKLRRAATSRILRLFQFPDPMVGWFPFAVITAVRAARKHQVDLIYTTSPPNTTSLVGVAVKLFTGLPLVTDFRDPWMDNTYQPRAGSLRTKTARRLEQWVFRLSDRIINISPDLDLKAKERAAPGLHPKFRVISNGYDPEDFAGFDRHKEPLHADSSFKITYSGCFYPGTRDPIAFLKGLALVAAQQPEAFSRMRVSFIGESSWPDENADALRQFNMGNHVEFLPFLPHQTVLARLRDSDLLLMIGSINRKDTGSLPGKMFEYLALGRPILALVHDGASADFIRAGGIGLVVSPEDPEEIAAGLLLAQRDIAEGKYRTDRHLEFLQRFDRRMLTARLAQTFDELVPVSGHR